MEAPRGTWTGRTCNLFNANSSTSNCPSVEESESESQFFRRTVRLMLDLCPQASHDSDILSPPPPMFKKKRRMTTKNLLLSWLPSLKRKKYRVFLGPGCGTSDLWALGLRAANCQLQNWVLGKNRFLISDSGHSSPLLILKLVIFPKLTFHTLLAGE